MAEMRRSDPKCRRCAEFISQTWGKENIAANKFRAPSKRGKNQAVANFSFTASAMELTLCRTTLAVAGSGILRP